MKLLVFCLHFMSIFLVTDKTSTNGNVGRKFIDFTKFSSETKVNIAAAGYMNTVNWYIIKALQNVERIFK